MQLKEKDCGRIGNMQNFEKCIKINDRVHQDAQDLCRSNSDCWTMPNASEKATSI